MEPRTLWSSGALAAGALATSLSVLSGATPAAAQATACTAAMDHDVHYCNDDTDLDPSFAPTCDPLALRWGEPGTPGDVVTITVEVRNDSEFQGAVAPVGPPAGELAAGTLLKVFYACSEPTCLDGEEHPDWLALQSIAYVHPDASFSDDGNGYSGTLSVDRDILFARGDTATLKLARIELAAGERHPSGPVDPNAIIFARAGQPGEPSFDDSANAIEVMDGECPISGPLGGGQGTTAAQLQPAPIDRGLHVCAHANKQMIKVDHSGSLDYGNSRVAFLFPGYDPSSCDLTFGYDNLVGGAFAFETLQPGDLQKAGKCYVYQNKDAPDVGGVQRAQVCPANSDPDKWCLNIKAYGDLDAILQDPEMPITISTCGQDYAGPNPPVHGDPLWTSSGRTWTLPKAVWTE